VPSNQWKKRPISLKTRSEVHVLRDVLRRDRFDICVDLQGALKSAFVGRMAKSVVLAGSANPRERAARWLYKLQVETESAHVVEQGCEILGAAVGEKLQPARVKLPMDEVDEHWADGAVGNERFCLISPGGGWGSKIWPAERYGRVAAELAKEGLRTVVNTSPAGSREADLVVQASEGAAITVPCSVGQLIALTRRAAVVVAGDTGPLHLAAALQRPVVAIFGPTDPARNGPYGTRSRVLRSAGSATSYKRSDEPELGMLRIEVEQVVAAALEMLDV
jgi:heptosyltransferase-1